MPKNKKVMSMAIKPELHTDLKRYTKQKHMSVSEYVGDLVERAMKIDVDEDPIIVDKPVDADVIPIVLKIPATLKGRREELQQWMNVQVSGIVNKLAAAKPVEA